MAQSVKIAGALFTDVPSIRVPDANDVYHPFVDPSPTTATDADVASGKIYFKADGTQSTGTASGGSATIISKTITANGTYNASSDNADGYDPVIVSVAGGLPLLATKSLGYFSNVPTSSTNTGQTMTVSNVGSYDYLLVVSSRDEGEPVDSGQFATFSIIYFTKNENDSSITSVAVMSVKTGIYKFNGAVDATPSSQAYGLYPNSPSVSSNAVSFSIYERKRSGASYNIDGNFTMRVYGINAYALV